MIDTRGDATPGSLDDLVAAVATGLMGVGSAGLAAAAQDVLRQMTGHLGVDLAFLRFHDLERRATVLVAEWPPRADVPEPDPLGDIAFDGADPQFAASEHLTDVMVVRPGAAGYAERVRAGSGETAVSTVVVPLRADGVTTGTLGFVAFGDREWAAAETRALRTVASLLTQLRARVTAEDRLRHVATHDELTGLPNRRALLAHLETTLAPGSPGPRALLFVDVDRLKAMNDFLGHRAGDAVIRGIAHRVRDAVGPGDLVARLGGDELVVALDGPADADRARETAVRVQAAMVDPMRLGGQLLARTISIGIALAHPGGSAVSAWLADADQAVLAAKARGGNAVVVHDAALRARSEVKDVVELDLRAAVRRGELTLAFQPVVDLRTRAVHAVEALARWTHPELGPVAPAVFVPVAEATNLAGELGAWVLDAACGRLAEWRGSAAGRGLVVSVNVSPVQLVATDFVARVGATLARHGLPGDALVLEITEHAVVSDLEATLATLRGLRALGVGVAVDDFGTGYSSLQQLKALPVTILKIDRAFVRDLGADPQDLAIVRAALGLADAFGLTAVAEGVETERAAAVLTGLGCALAQGYLFSRPVPAEQVPALLGAAPAQDRGAGSSSAHTVAGPSERT